MTAPRRPGSALLAAVALLALTSIVTLELTVTGRARRLAAANAIELAAANAVARAGLDDARARLLRSLYATGQNGLTAADPWATMVALPIAPVSLGELRYEVTVRDGGTALPLNQISEDQLRRLFAALRVDAGRADRVSQAILDWRDGDDLRRARGAERADYLRHGSPTMPANAPFGSLPELRHVAGVDEPLYTVVRPFLTVVGSGRVNLNAAAPPVLFALPGMTEESVELVMRYRRQGRRITNVNVLAQQLTFGARRRLVEAMPAFGAAVVLDTREVHVTSTASSSTGIERARAEALMIKDNGVQVAWRRVVP